MMADGVVGREKKAMAERTEDEPQREAMAEMRLPEVGVLLEATAELRSVAADQHVAPVAMAASHKTTTKEPPPLDAKCSDCHIERLHLKDNEQNN